MAMSSLRLSVALLCATAATTLGAVVPASVVTTENLGAAPVALDFNNVLVARSVGAKQSVLLGSGESAASTTSHVFTHTHVVDASQGALTGITFSFQNLFNSSTEPIEVDKTSVNLWSGTWAPSPLDAPCNGEFKPIKAGSVEYGFKAVVNPADPKNPNLINGSFVVHPKPCTTCGNFSQGFAAYAFAMISEGGGQEIIIETGGAATDDMYSEEFGSIVGDQMVYTLILRHRDCDPEGWSKCKACTCPPPAAAAVNMAL